MTYQIKFFMDAPICYIDRPIFDSILAYCWMQDRYGHVPQKLNLSKEELETFDELPLVRHPIGYFQASIMFFKKEIEFIGSWKKRWHNKDDQIADFGKLKRKVDVSAGTFKSYSMPMSLHSVPEVSFFFESDNVGEVERLIDCYLAGMGKKRSQGYGFWNHFEISESDRKFEAEILRPIPIQQEDITGLNVRYCGWKIPYWLPENMALCIYPNIEEAS